MASKRIARMKEMLSGQDHYYQEAKRIPVYTATKLSPFDRLESEWFDRLLEGIIQRYSESPFRFVERPGRCSVHTRKKTWRCRILSWQGKNKVQPSNQGRDDIQCTHSLALLRTEELMRTIDQSGNHESTTRGKWKALARLKSQQSQQRKWRDSSSPSSRQEAVNHFKRKTRVTMRFVFVIRMFKLTKNAQRLSHGNTLKEKKNQTWE